MVINPQFQRAAEFSEGRAAVEVEGKWGYINSQGKVVVKPIFDSAWYFREGLGRVQSYKSSGLISTGFIGPDGDLLIPMTKEQLIGTRDGLAPMMIDHRHFYMDSVGTAIIEPISGTCSRDLPEGIPAIKNFGQYFYIVDSDSGRETVGESVSLLVNYFCDGVARAYLGQKFEYIDLHGGILTEGQLVAKRKSLDPPMPKKMGGSWGYIDKNLNSVISARFELASPFSNGLAAVQINKKWGFIDTTGKVIIEAKFEWVKDFSNCLSVAKMGDRIGYIDRTGNFISPK